MKNIFLTCLAIAINILCQPVFSQEEKDAKELGLPGDNLDLYAVLSLFQKSKTIEDFEKSLNEQKTGINNLDLDLDKKVDFIKVVTKKEGDSFSFILEVSVSKTETQDVAVILVDKDKAGKVTMQLVGDQALYGKNYVIEPKTAPTAAVTANPAYTGAEPVSKSVPPSTSVVIETVPIVQYVYSPVYVPYYPPYHYGYYPPYFAAFTVIAVGIYRHNNYYHHEGYYGGHYHGGGNTVIIHNKNVYNNYNNNKMRSTTVSHNTSSGRYNAVPANSNSTHTATTSNRQAKSTSATTRQSARSNRANSRASNAAHKPSASRSMGGGRTRNGGGGRRR